MKLVYVKKKLKIIVNLDGFLIVILKLNYYKNFNVKNI